MTHLYLIRHGEAYYHANGIINDYGLTEKGIAQAKRLRDRLAATGEIKADVLISSTFTRARQTAEIIAPALNLPILFDDDFQEMRPGEAINIPIDEYNTKYSQFRQEEDPFVSMAPGAENWGQFMLRVGTTLDRVTKQYEGKTVVAVCHGGIIDGSFLYFFGMDTLRFPRTHFFTHNTSITYWRCTDEDADGRDPIWRLVRYNDDMHLLGLEKDLQIPWDIFSQGIQPEEAEQPGIVPPEQ